MRWLTSLIKLGSNSVPASAFILAASYVLWAAGSAGWGAVHHDRQKSLQKIESHKNEPITIVKTKALNKTVRLGEQFDGGDDWLSGAQLRLKNVSGKDIVYIDIRLNFPETTASGNMMSFWSDIGNRPGLPAQNAPLLLRPNDEVTFSLDQERYKNLVKFIEYRHRVSDINRVEIRFGFVAFADGTGWSGGNFMKQDANNPRRYVPIDNQPQN